MGCQHIYKDVDGNPSAIYERALEKYGPEKAEEIYIRHMIDAIDTKKSVATTSDVTSRSNELEDPGEGAPYYIHKISRKNFDRVTTGLKTITTYIPSTPEFFGKVKTEEESLAEAKTNLAKTLILSTLTMEEQAIPNKVNDMIAADPSLLEKAEHDIKALWDAQKEAGTYFHKLMNAVINAWEDEANLRETTKGAALTINDIGFIINKGKQSLGDNILGSNYDKIYDVAKPFFEYVLAEQKSRKGERIYLKSELKVFSEDLKLPNSPSDGIAGTIDVLMHTAKKDYNKTVDFKTKIAYKAKDFDKPSGKTIRGMFGVGRPDTPHNQSFAQQLTYAAVLRQPEYNHLVTHAVTFVVPIAFASDIYEDSMASHIDNTITYLTDGDINVSFEKARVDGIAGVTEKWSGEDEDGVPNATWTKDHKASTVARLIRMRYKDLKRNKIVARLNHEIIELEGLSEEQMVTVLGSKYDELKAEHTNIGNDVINFFEHPDSTKLPKSLQGKALALGTLLRGMTYKTHDLMLAQNMHKSLRGVGPDVLVAVNKATGAVSILSAVTIMNTRVNFKSDGSRKDKRTSLLGNYVADPTLESRAMSSDLMSEVKTHDFIALKLGLTAMNLKKVYSDLNIDQMKVVSMGYDNSVFETSTTFEEELGKLKMFERYAGTDFPTEYSELLKEASTVEYVGATAKHMDHLFKMIDEGKDPLGSSFKPEDKKILSDLWARYNSGELVGFELKQRVGKYLQNVAVKLHYTEFSQ